MAFDWQSNLSTILKLGLTVLDLYKTEINRNRGAITDIDADGIHANVDAIKTEIQKLDRRHHNPQIGI